MSYQRGTGLSSTLFGCDQNNACPSPYTQLLFDLASDSDDDDGYIIREDIDHNLNPSAPYCIASPCGTAISSTFSAMARNSLHNIKVSIRASDKAQSCMLC